MRLDAVAVTNFRNFREALIRPSPGVNLFLGDNGSGKTNLLEAIFTLCLGKSQRAARDAMLIREGGDDYFRLEGVGQVEGREVRLACAYQTGGRKKITVDDNPVRVSKLYELFSIISMAPEDVALMAGSPSERRRFLDIYISQASPSYLADLTDYNKALAQKNSFLKNRPAEQCPFDSLLVERGATIIAARHRFIHFLQALAPGYYDQITGAASPEKQMFMLAYKPNVPFGDKDEIARNFERKLAAYRDKEAILETAIVGPHRDDMEFAISGLPARGYGSQGEMRSAAVAVMLATANFLESRRNEKPILLLDEIFAELDQTRKENLARLFAAFEQIFLTTAIAPPKVLNDRATFFHITAGEVTQG
jgi:DNA replication and repair protein RecF